MFQNHVYKFFALAVSILFYSCTTTIKLPLCPRLGNQRPSEIDGVSKTLYIICKDKEIKINRLSSTIAEFTGSVSSIKWLEKNYFIILCDFDQTKIPNDEKVYGECMSKAKEWIAIVQGKRPDTLMLSTYCNVCCEIDK